MESWDLSMGGREKREEGKGGRKEKREGEGRMDDCTHP